MGKFVLVDSKRYPIVHGEGGMLLPYWKWEHRGTVVYQNNQGKESYFLVIMDAENNVAYIEELEPEGQLKEIESDQLHKDISKFAAIHNLLELKPPIPKPISGNKISGR